MEQSQGDILHCDEQLRTTLHSDDKEKLRKRLSLLQREYLRTVQKLQRAEQLETVREHVRSRITQHQHQDHRGSEVSSLNPCPDRGDGPSRTDKGPSRYQGHNGDSTPDPARDQRPSPSLRLRSRCSRLRWEKRRRKSPETARSIDTTSEEGQEPSERIECATRNEDEERAKSQEMEVVNESEELLSGSESESPSLLLAHWNTGARGKERTGKTGGQEQCEKETELRGERNKNDPVHTEGGRRGGTQNGREKEDERGTQPIHGRPCEESGDKETEHNEKSESKRCHGDSVEVKEEAIETAGTEREGKSEGILGSCTLVDGLIFPVEYYVRTTRRMTLSQSQPDMQAVILSQLGGGRGGRRRRQPGSRSAQNSQTAASVGSQPAVATHPARGSKRKKGRDRGKNLTSPRSASPSPSTPGPAAPKLRLVSEEPIPSPKAPQPTSTKPADALPASSGLPGPESSLENVYPIFLTSSSSSSRAKGRAPNRTSWQSLLLPSSPSPSSQTSPLPQPLVSSLAKFDLLQDFHLPDDQFASLKLHKLRQVAAAAGAEHFTPPSHNTRTRRAKTGGPATPLPLPFSLTPTLVYSPQSPGEPQAAAPPEDLHTSTPAESAPVVPASATDHVDLSKDQDIQPPSIIAVEKQTDCPPVLCILEEQTPAKHHTEDKVAKSFTNSDTDDLEECSGTRPDLESPPRNHQTSSTRHSVPSQLLLSPSLSLPGLLPSAPPSSPPLPSLGPTPRPALPLTSSPRRPPSLSLPTSHSPSTRALSPPLLSPSLTPAVLPPSLQPAETVEEGTRCTHTLKIPAGGPLVDVCCLPRPSGGLCVAAAGKWAVCVWNQTSTSDWNLAHTWTFGEPVINVFPVPDAAGLMCVTLGQLEIREVRMLSCSSLLQMLLCVGMIQAVVGVAKSRVAVSSHSASGSTVEAFTAAEDSSAPSCQSLASPGVCVTSLAAVDGLPDALIGTDDAGALFVWNMRTGQLLQRMALGGALSNTACLRGHSSSGLLFVWLQHHFLGSLEEGEMESQGIKDQMFPIDKDEDERKRSALFSLVATNPLSGKGALATRLYAPTAWCGRLCEADVNCSRVVGLSQSGCVCVWDLGYQGGAQVVQAPESDGWQLARWGGRDTLVTGHYNGDVTLHCYTLCHLQDCV
ncbi:uncharacterized protein palb2 [Genypterus blacodes]|uniref:uncharacterized protein palb2 n=1 Tax=Genypterus blacodes TaxID=154954 RepID=UPI003F7707D0